MYDATLVGLSLALFRQRLCTWCLMHFQLEYPLYSHTWHHCHLAYLYGFLTLAGCKVRLSCHICSASTSRAWRDIQRGSVWLDYHTAFPQLHLISLFHVFTCLCCSTRSPATGKAIFCSFSPGSSQVRTQESAQSPTLSDNLTSFTKHGCSRVGVPLADGSLPFFSPRQSSCPSAVCCACCRLSLWQTSKAWPTVRTMRMAWLWQINENRGRNSWNKVWITFYLFSCNHFSC